MSKRTKQFKIGEYAVGGIIKVEIINDHVNIDALDYYSKKSVLFDKKKIRLSDRWGVDVYLNNLTTSYYSDKILEFIYGKK
jgi:hypothetical protein